MKSALLFTTVLFILFPVSKISYAHSSSDKLFIAQSSEIGELTILHLEQLARDFKINDERLFVIKRLGENEIPGSSFRRLALTKFKLSLMGFDSKKLLLAEGEKIAGEGRIEFYLGSELRMILLAKHNQMPNFTCCPDYFPPVKSKRKHRHK